MFDLSKAAMKKVLLIITFTVLLLVGLQNFSSVTGFFGAIGSVLSPFLLGAAIAFLLNIPMRFFERKIFPLAPEIVQGKGKGTRIWYKLKRPVSLIITFILLIGILILAFFIIFPEIGRTIAKIAEGLPDFTKKAAHFFSELASKYPVIADNYPELTAQLESIQLDWNSIGQKLISFLQNGAVNLLSSTIGVASSIISGMMSFFFGFIFAMYLLFQKETLARQCTRFMRAYFPDRFTDKVLSVSRLTAHTFSRFFSGQCLEALILGTLFFISMSIFHFPYALMISVMISLLALIPIFGAFIGCFLGAFLILMISPIQALWFIVLFLVVQQIEGNLIYPHVVGTSVDLPSMWVLVAVMVGGSLMGIVGMLIFIPLCSVVYSLLRANVGDRLAPPAVEEPKNEEHTSSEKTTT